MSGNSDQLSESPDEGEWRIIVEKKRSIVQRVKASGKIMVDDRMVHSISEILNCDSGFRDVRVTDQ